MSTSAPYITITADTHAGASIQGYRDYLDPSERSDFDDWRSAYASPSKKHLGGKKTKNWDARERATDLAGDGVAAEVIFPNTVPPFYDTAFHVSPTAKPQQYTRWLAGTRAHNRWLADFCAEAPGRRAGVAQILLPNVEGSVEEIRWAREHGLFGGVFLPGAPPGSGLPPLYAPEYEPIWAVCEELEMPINHHSGGGTPDFGMHLPQSLAMYMLEVTWWAHRTLWHLMFSGVFERYPKLQFALTETGTAWVPGVLNELDEFYSRMKYEDQCSEHMFGGPAVAKLSLKPSEYFARQCHIGASFLSPKDCALRHEIGIDRIMWGSDYPHIEGSYPYTRELLRLTFAGVDPAEIQQLVAGNVAALYGFDLDLLAPLAARFGPTRAEIAEPFDYGKLPAAARKCPGFAPERQVQAA